MLHISIIRNKRNCTFIQRRSSGVSQEEKGVCEVSRKPCSGAGESEQSPHRRTQVPEGAVLSEGRIGQVSLSLSHRNHNAASALRVNSPYPSHEQNNFVVWTNIEISERDLS